MIKSVLKEGKKAGFSTVEAFQEKVEKREYENFIDYHASHSTRSNRMTIRAFWDSGDPVGFNLSDPDLESIRTAFSNIYTTNFPDRRKNYSHLLPDSAQKVKIDIFDDSIDSINDRSFFELIDRICEIIISFPGLKLKKILFSKILKKAYLTNSKNLNIKYKKTNFNLILSFSFGNNHIDISENRIFFDQIEPFRTISRAFNLLNSLTENKDLSEQDKYLILSPEASSFILKEFSSYLKMGEEGEKIDVGFPSVLNIIDNPLLDRQTGSAPFDDEGIQSGEKFLIKKGEFLGLISDIKTAFQFNSVSTGNGFRSERSIFPCVRFSNLYIKPSVLSLKNLMKDAENGILVSLVKLKYIENNKYFFSAYGYRFKNEDILEPVHFYFKTSFLSYFLNILKISKEIKFFYNLYNIGSPYILFEAKPKDKNILEI